MDTLINYIRNLFNWNSPTAIAAHEPRKRNYYNSDAHPHLTKRRRLGTFMAMSSPKERMIRIDKRRGHSYGFSNRQVCTDVSHRQTHRLYRARDSIDLSDDDDEIVVVASPDRKPVAERCPRRPALSASDDDDVLFVTCVESDEARAKRSGYRFFKSRVDSPIEPRTFSVKRSKYNSSSGSKPNESIRLDEKRKYREMLSKMTPSPWSSRNVTTPCSKVDSRTRARKLVDLAVDSPVIDLTDEASKNRCAAEPSSVSSDSDVECLGTVPISRNDRPILRVNSLKSMLDLKPVCDSDWVKKLTQQHEDSIREKKKQIEECRTRAELFRTANEKLYNEALEERIRKSMHITDAVLVEDEEPEELFPPLTAEQEAIVRRALNPNPPSEVLVEKFNIRVTRHDVHTLAGLNWLNDEVINFYMNLLMERGKRDDLPGVHAFNTFFYPKLMSGGHSALRRWTKKIDVFSFDLILVPIHLGMHWCMCIVDFRDKSVRYYDSMGGHNRKCVEALLRYLVDERADKKGEKYETKGWTMPVASDIPQQMNGSDCGMFSCTFAEFACRDAKFEFSQNDMPYLRRKMVYEIVTGTLLL